MVFIAILILTTLVIASSAAFFSVYGLAQIFAGSFWPVVIMASSLEAGKLVAASYVYRYWEKISSLMKSYLISAIVTLMVITSAGIFGFLSSAYQQDILPMKIKEQKISLLESEKAELETLKSERLERRKQIDADIAALPNNFITGRQRLMESYGGELEQLRTDVATYTDQIREKTIQLATLKNEKLESEAHVGPIIFIAKAFGTEVDDATKWLIFLIIFAFDPLAVVLTIGANIALADLKILTTPKRRPVFEYDDDDDDPMSSDFMSEPEPSIVEVEQLQDEVERLKAETYEDVVDEEPTEEEVIPPAPRNTQTSTFKPHSALPGN